MLASQQPIADEETQGGITSAARLRPDVQKLAAGFRDQGYSERDAQVMAQAVATSVSESAPGATRTPALRTASDINAEFFYENGDDDEGGYVVDQGQQRQGARGRQRNSARLGLNTLQTQAAGTVPVLPLRTRAPQNNGRRSSAEGTRKASRRPAATSFAPGLTQGVNLGGVAVEVAAGRRPPKPAERTVLTTWGRNLADQAERARLAAIFVQSHQACANAYDQYRQRTGRAAGLTFSQAIERYLADVNRLQQQRWNYEDLNSVLYVMYKDQKIPSALSNALSGAAGLSFTNQTGPARYAHAGVVAKNANPMVSALWAAIAAQCVEGYNIGDFFEFFHGFVNAALGGDDALKKRSLLPQNPWDEGEIEAILGGAQERGLAQAQGLRASFAELVAEFLAWSPECRTLLASNTEQRTEFVANVAEYIGLATLPGVTAKDLHAAHTAYNAATGGRLRRVPTSGRDFAVGNQSTNQSMPVFAQLQQNGRAKLPYIWNLISAYCASPERFGDYIEILANMVASRPNARTAVSRAKQSGAYTYYDGDRNFSTAPLGAPTGTAAGQQQRPVVPTSL